MTTDSIILPHGGYQDLLCYRKSVVVYLGTVWYCKRFLRHPDRTIDQMVQGARSGKQNIVEGNQNSGTSKEIEIRLTDAARGSLQELQEDYKDQLRTRNLVPWDENDERMKAMRSYCHYRNDWKSYQELYETRSVETLCNLSICLINQTSELISNYLAYLAEQNNRTGSLRERMTTARHEALGEKWKDTLYHHLSAASSEEDLEQRYNEMIEKLNEVRWEIAKRRGWKQ